MTAPSMSRRTFVAAAASSAAVAAAASSVALADGAAATYAANADWLGAEPEDGEIVETKECELLIVGAGNGGMAAAATAADLGVDFLVAEAYDTPNDTRHWIGAINTKYTEAADALVDVKREQYELARYASFKCNQRLQKMWIDESAELIDWLDTIMGAANFECAVDAEMGPEIDPTYHTGCYVPAQQHMYHSTDPDFKGLDNRNEVLQAYVEEKAGAEKFLWNHDLVKLVHADGKVTGAIFSTDEGNVQVNAANVILATGGYPGNPDMMSALSPMAVACCTASSFSPKDRGMGIKAALWAGATMDVEAAPMVFNRGLVAPGVDCGYDENGLFRGTVSQFNIGSQPFMKVARDGKRFMNEACPYDFTCFAAQQHNGGVWAMIFDANCAEDVARFATDGCSKMTQSTLANTPDPAEAYASQIEAGLLFQADTIEELAEKLGFEGDAKDAFLAEVERYNGFYDAQDDEDFGKEAYRLSQIRTAPFYGGWFGGSLLTTCDGITINEECQALDADRNVVEGLYAIGDCSGRFFANNYPEYLIGVACGRTVTEGRHVVRTLAGDL